jgi:hypothetical protein
MTKQQRIKSLVTAFILAVLIAIGSISCRPQQIKEFSHKTVKDSVYTEITYHKKDTVIIIEGDTLKIKLPITQITEKPISVRGYNTEMLISKLNEQIEVVCKYDELTFLIQLQEKRIKQFEQSKINSDRVEVVKQKFIPKWAKTLLIIGSISTIILFYIIINAIKK